MNDAMQIEGYTQEEIDAVLASDDPDLIDRMLSGEKVEISVDKPAEANQAAVIESFSSTENKQDEMGAASGAVVDAIPGDEQANGEKYIESKSGGNKIPYGVLEQTRKERDQLSRQLQETQARLSAVESTSSKMQAHLEKSGIDLSSLEQGEKLSEEQLAELECIDPSVARLARITMSLFDRVENVQTRIESSGDTVADQVEAAIVANGVLDKWRNSDPDRWDTAVFYDEQLKQTPAFRNKSYSERFAEAVRLTQSAFGDPVEETTKQNRVDPAAVAAQKVAQATSSAVPRTLTDLGKATQSERPLGEILSELDYDTLTEKMADMSSEQIDRLIAEAG